jgi:hypothetical protein
MAPFRLVHHLFVSDARPADQDDEFLRAQTRMHVPFF